MPLGLASNEGLGVAAGTARGRIRDGDVYGNPPHRPQVLWRPRTCVPGTYNPEPYETMANELERTDYHQAYDERYGSGEAKPH